jgi:hypothetical protein
MFSIARGGKSYKNQQPKLSGLNCTMHHHTTPTVPPEFPILTPGTATFIHGPKSLIGNEAGSTTHVVSDIRPAPLSVALTTKGSMKAVFPCSRTPETAANEALSRSFAVLP